MFGSCKKKTTHIYIYIYIYIYRLCVCVCDVCVCGMYVCVCFACFACLHVCMLVCVWFFCLCVRFCAGKSTSHMSARLPASVHLHLLKYPNSVFKSRKQDAQPKTVVPMRRVSAATLKYTARRASQILSFANSEVAGSGADTDVAQSTTPIAAEEEIPVTLTVSWMVSFLLGCLFVRGRRGRRVPHNFFCLLP